MRCRRWEWLREIGCRDWYWRVRCRWSLSGGLKGCSDLVEMVSQDLIDVGLHFGSSRAAAGVCFGVEGGAGGGVCCAGELVVDGMVA